MAGLILTDIQTKKLSRFNWLEFTQNIVGSDLQRVSVAGSVFNLNSTIIGAADGSVELDASNLLATSTFNRQHNKRN